MIRLKAANRLLAMIQEVGRIVLFTVEVLKRGWQHGVPWGLLVDQIYQVGVRSLGITVIAGGFVGAIMAIQINLQLRDFGAQGFLGGLSTSTTIRDVGPTLIAFLLSGKVGAFTSAELGIMKVTEQVDAIRCLGADPYRYLILPRMLAVVFSSFLLLLVGLFLTVMGGMGMAALELGVSPQSYVMNVSRLVSLQSVGMGVTKSLVFGVVIAAVSCYYGYQTEGGAFGVGESVRKTSVVTLIAIIVLNLATSSALSFLFALAGVGS